MNFGDALEVLRAGARVQREGWNGKGMHLVLVRPRMYQLVGEEFVLDLRLQTATGTVELAPWIGMLTAQGTFVPWLASQTDLLAEDWSVVP